MGRSGSTRGCIEVPFYGARLHVALEPSIEEPEGSGGRMARMVGYVQGVDREGRWAA